MYISTIAFTVIVIVECFECRNLKYRFLFSRLQISLKSVFALWL